MHNAGDSEVARGQMGVEDGPKAGVWTVERAAWVAVGLLAAGLRLCQLGLRPLNEGEAVQALAAYRFVHGAALTAPAGTVPALFSGNVVSTSLLGASDVTVRLLPALVGVILALLPYGLRDRLGRGGALAAALFLAVSPSAVYFSRQLDGAIVVAACGLALVVGLIRTIDTHRPGGIYLAAGAVGVGLCSGPGFWTVLLSLAAFGLGLYLAERWPGRPSGWQAVRSAATAVAEAWQAVRGEKGLPAKAGAVLAATFVLVATTFVLHPAGVGHAADLIGAWAKGFLPEAGGQTAAYPLLLLVRYEALVVVLGLVETGRAIAEAGRQRAGPAFPHTPLLVWWAGAAAVVAVAAGHRPAGTILPVVVPLALLAGQGVERAWRWVSDRFLWPEGGAAAAVALGLGAFAYMQMGAYALTGSGASAVSFAGVSLPEGSAYLLLVGLAVVLLAGLGAATWLWRGRGAVIAGGWLAVIIMLGLFGLKAMWGVSLAPGVDRLDLIEARPTQVDVQAFVAEMEALSKEEAGDAHTLPVTVDAATGPVVSWYLREFESQTVVDDPTTAPDTTVVVTMARQDLPIGETFRGRSFVLRTYWQPWGLSTKAVIQWLLLNAGSVPTVDREVVVWVAGGE